MWTSWMRGVASLGAQPAWAAECSIPQRNRAAILAGGRHEWGAAWKFANAALNEDSDSIEALYLAGRALRDFGHIGLSLHLFRRALALDNTKPAIWMHFAASVPRLRRR